VPETISIIQFQICRTGSGLFPPEDRIELNATVCENWEDFVGVDELLEDEVRPIFTDLTNVALAEVQAYTWPHNL